MKWKYVVGLMSGTSLDGVDAVLLRVRGSGTTTRFHLVGQSKRQFPSGLKRLLLKNSLPETSRVDDICRLNFLLAEMYYEAVKSVARKAGVKFSQIALIGSHGQTIHHLPKPHRMFGKMIRSTLQIGDPSALAAISGIKTVGDFRVADVAVGGEGAPLVPYFDWLVFRSKTKNRLILNIGGIANITVLPKNCLLDEIAAFDTGPGNMVVDSLMQEFYRRPFDKNGDTAARGMIVLELLKWMKRHPFLKRKPPKTTGREEFGQDFIRQLLERAKHYDREDIIATATFFTVYAVLESYGKFIAMKMQADEIIVSGGGVKNRALMRALRSCFPESTASTTNEWGIPSEAKEAICFAILANETIAGNPTNIPSATGAARKVILGKICFP